MGGWGCRGARKKNEKKIYETQALSSRKGCLFVLSDSRSSIDSYIVPRSIVKHAGCVKIILHKSRCPVELPEYIPVAERRHR